MATPRATKFVPHVGPDSMGVDAPTAIMGRAFVAAKMVMALVNCGGCVAARVRAEKLLDDYFALVERAVPWTEHNPLDRRS